MVSQPLNFDELKRSCLTLVKKWLYEDELHDKLLKAPKFAYSRLLAKVNHLLFISSKSGSRQHLTLLKQYKISKVGQNSLPKKKVLERF